MSVSYRGVVGALRQVGWGGVAATTGGHSHGDLGHLHVSRASQPRDGAEGGLS